MTWATLALMVHSWISQARGSAKLASRLAAGVAVLALFGTSAGSAAEDPRFPGLPKYNVAGDWVSPRATGINYVDRAKQWVRLPPMVVVAFSPVLAPKSDASCLPGVRIYPYRQTARYSGTLYLRSSAGAPKPYGYLGPFKVRTVAFGNIPVEASIQLRQPRDDEDLPVGLEAVQDTGIFCPSTQGRQNKFPDRPNENNEYVAPAQVDGRLEVGVVGLKVDGVDLKLSKGCRTSQPGAVSLRGREYYKFDPDVSPEEQPTPENLYTTPFFTLTNGGLLNGSVDIPAFTGCVTSGGENVSRLLTAAVSGDDNPVVMRSDGLALGCLEPGASCEPLNEIPFPARD